MPAIYLNVGWFLMGGGVGSETNNWSIGISAPGRDIVITGAALETLFCC